MDRSMSIVANAKFPRRRMADTEIVDTIYSIPPINLATKDLGDPAAFRAILILPSTQAGEILGRELHQLV